jgi:hypothetical protein
MEHLRIGLQVSMREHGTLASTRGARGVENGRKLIGADRLDRMLIWEANRTLEQGAIALGTQSL